MFGRRKKDEDPFAALRDGSTYQSAPTTISDLGATGLGSDPGMTRVGAPAPAAQPTPVVSATVAQAPPVAPAPPTQAPPVAGAPTTQAPPVAGAPTTQAPLTTKAPLTSLRPTTIPPVRQRRSGAGCGGQVVVAVLVAVAVGVAVAIPLIGAGNTVHVISGPTEAVPANTAPGSSSPSPTPPKPVSYLNPAAVRVGLRHVEQIAPGARLTLLRLDADSLDTTAVLPNRTLKLIHFGPTGTFVTAGADTGETPIPISQIRPSVVARLVVELGRRFHVPPSQIDYMVISSPQGSVPKWILFSKAPSHPGFSAALSGADLARIPR